VGAVAALLLTGDPAPEGSEPPSAEASPTVTSEPPPEPRDEPALTEVKTFDHVSNRPEELVVEDRNLWVVASSRSHPVQFRLPSGNRPSTLELGRGASAIVGDRGTLWIAYKPQNRVVHLNARTGAFLGQIDTALGPSAVAVGTSGLWIATQDRRDSPAELLHYTRDGATRLGSMPIDNGVADMVHGAGSMWMAIQDTRTIRRYTADFRWRVATDLLALPSDLAWGGGRLWALSGGRTLTRFDPETKDSAHEDLPGLPGRVGISRGLAVVALPSQDRLFLVDARTVERKRKPFVDAPGGPYGVTTQGRNVFVTAQNEHAVIQYRR